MFESLTVGMCVAFGAGCLVGAGAGVWATSLYYESGDSQVGEALMNRFFSFG